MFHPYSFYLQKHKNAKIKRESALPFFSFPLLLHLVIHTPNAPNRLLLCPISPFGVSHFTIWGIPFHLLGCPIWPFGVSHFTFWDVPFYLLGYPILPFGVSHFTIWGIFSAHLRTMYSPIFGLPSSFSLQNICVFFVNWENWFSTFLHFCNFVFLMMFHHRRNLRSVFLKLIWESSR